MLHNAQAMVIIEVWPPEAGTKHFFKKKPGKGNNTFIQKRVAKKEKRKKERKKPLCTVRRNCFLCYNQEHTIRAIYRSIVSETPMMVLSLILLKTDCPNRTFGTGIPNTNVEKEERCVQLIYLFICDFCDICYYNVSF